MSTHAPTAPVDLGQRRLDDLAPKVFRAGGAVFALALVLAAFISFFHREAAVQRFFATYLVCYSFFLSITLGGLFFVILQHLVKAGWSVVVRRVAEGVASNVWLMGLLLIPVLIGMKMGYLHPTARDGGDHHVAAAGHGDAGAHGDAAHGDAAHGDAAHGDAAPAAAGPVAPPPAVIHHMDESKKWWLSFWPLTLRLVGYHVLWLIMAGFYFRQSVAQDTTKDIAHTNRMQWWSPLAMILFAFSAAFCAFDLLMALDPYWYSTMFGVYFFAGCAVSFFATLSLLLIWLQGRGYIAAPVTAEHYQDVGKLMFAFTVFWAYVTFSQFMLIWYGNIPEETTWFLRRQEGGWAWVGVWLIFGHFFIPFFFVLSRWVKRARPLLAIGAVWLLVAHYSDLFYVVLPETGARSLPVPLIDMFLLVGLGGLYVAGVVFNLRGVSLIPEGDPRLAESLAFENV